MFEANFYSQWDADHVGTGDCVPTCLKMILSLYGRPAAPIAEIRDHCDADLDGVINLGRDAGITLDAAQTALSGTYGVPCSTVSSRQAPFEDVLASVMDGKATMVFIQYGAIMNRVDRSFAGLHAILLVGVDHLTSSAIVLDPDRDLGGQHPDQRGSVNYSLEELRRGWDQGAGLGGGALICDNAMEEDMDPLKFKEMFLAVYKDIGVAAKFDALADQIGGLLHMVEAIEAGEALDDAEVAALKGQIGALKKALAQAGQ